MQQGLSIIIVNYYSEKYIIPLVDSIVSTIELSKYEIIIISNSPSIFKWNDGFMKKNHIHIIDSSSNEGFGRGINRGVCHSRYDYFCMLNPDVEIDKSTLDDLYAYFQTVDSDVGAVSCFIKNSDNTRQNTFFMDKGLLKKSFTLLYLRNLFPGFIRRVFFQDNLYINDAPEKYDFSMPFEVGGFYAPFVMMKKNAFLDVGGFDPDYFMYAEDVDLFRTRFSGKYKCMLYPLVKLTHLSGKTDRYGLMSQQAQVSYLLYLRKVGNYYLFVFTSLLSLKYMLLLLRSLLKRSDRREAISFFKSLKYLSRILRYPRGYGTLPVSLKIDEIPD